MPVMDGYTAAKLIREWEQNHHALRTPIIALTASVLDEAVHKSFDAGCDTHVSKPVRRPTLVANIHEVTAKSQDERTAGAGRSRRRCPAGAQGRVHRDDDGSFTGIGRRVAAQGRSCR